MKVKTSRSTVEKLIQLLERFDASTEDFLDDLPTPEKYTILAVALIVRGDYEDFEIAFEESMCRFSAQSLTKHLLNFKHLDCHLKDALQLKWSCFEQVWSEDDQTGEA